ncbi:hypothetical protein SESBI_18040 [Sesbania bispinosa]|nr:hypothetical protein SESBI_18040 [Sesbania bispinosa]
MSNPLFVWESTWELLADGILHNLRQSLNCPGLELTQDVLKNMCLLEIEKVLQGNGKSLKDFDPMPFPDNYDSQHFTNILLFNELNFDLEEMRSQHELHIDWVLDLGDGNLGKSSDGHDTTVGSSLEDEKGQSKRCCGFYGCDTVASAIHNEDRKGSKTGYDDSFG